MNKKSEYIVSLIFSKLKNYKAKEIFLEKEDFKKFIFLLFKDNWIKRKIRRPDIVITNMET